MSQTIHISEKSAALLTQQAAAHGKTLEAWIEELALQKAEAADSTHDEKTALERNPTGRSLVDQMRDLRARVQPDPEGWTVRDYINYGRR